MIGVRLYESGGNMGMLRGVWLVSVESGWVLCSGSGSMVGVMSVCVVSLDYLCRWQVQVSVYCARGYLRI